MQFKLPGIPSISTQQLQAVSRLDSVKRFVVFFGSGLSATATVLTPFKTAFGATRYRLVDILRKMTLGGPALQWCSLV
eukprot:13263808-Alexandrium_andersonii.AAC.1